MTSPLQGSLARKIGKAFARSIFYDASLTRVTVGDAEKPWDSGDPAPTTYTCKAIIDTYSAFEFANSRIDNRDVKVLILATTIAIEPVAGDTVTIRGNVYTVIKVDTDPARAVWVCQSRIGSPADASAS